jgi:hypothetical protein
MKLHANYTDAEANEHVLTGDSVEEIAAQLPEGYTGPTIEVRDEPGFTRGWVQSRGAWTAK